MSEDPIIARMNEIEAEGQYDLDTDGLRRSRHSKVGDAMMTCQVAVLGDDILIVFWAVEGDGHQRRFLVDQNNRVWMDNNRNQVVRRASKYDKPIERIIATRAN